MSDDKKNTHEVNRIIYVSGNINENKAENIVTKLFQYECSDPSKDVLLFVDSYGGEVDSFITIHDVMQLSRCNIATVCIGKAMSVGAMILLSGGIGKRFITPNSHVMIHEISYGSSGKLTDVETDYEEAKRLQKDVVEKIILQRTKITQKQLQEFMSKDTYLTAKDCIKYGLVDHIIHNSQALYSHINI